MNSTFLTSVLGVIAALVILFFAVPMIAGGSTNICKDVAVHNVKSTAAGITGTTSGPVYNVINSVGQAGATGTGEAEQQSHEHPNTPTAISCASDFWSSL